MKHRIQRSLVLILSITLLISYALMTLVVYEQTLNVMEEEVRQESDYIRTAVEISGTGYLNEMDAVRKNTRVTRIDKDGQVLYDSTKDSGSLQNHRSRKEVKEALETGSGQDMRVSDTVKKEMYYYAVLLNDGTVLRVSKTMDTAFYTAIRVFPYMSVIAVIMMLLALALSKWQTKKLIEPINKLDLEHPLSNDVYEELTPFLESMDRQNREKAAVEQMRREFSANVSHELKTPLTSISGYAEIMKDGLVRPEDMKGFSERIYHEASRLIVLVEDIIKLSKLDEGSVETEREEVDLFGICRDVCTRLSYQAEQKKVHLEVSGEPVFYTGIRRILEEMIYNICENAVKYNKEGGTVTIWAGNTLKGKKVIVTDSGIGIPKEEQERIFERFYRVDKSHSRENGGTGLGLSIVKHGAMLHHAEIQVESEPGNGTKIELTF